MTKNLIAFLIISAVGCSSCQDFDNDQRTTFAEKADIVRGLQGKYCELAEAHIADVGYAVSKCDGALFSSLHAIGCGYPGIGTFEKEAGKFYRSPSHDCFPDNGADSTISKDMIAGILLHTAFTKDGARAKRMLDYCNDHRVGANLGCQVGNGKNVEVELSKTVLPPTTITIIEDMVEKYFKQNSVSHASETGPVIINDGYEGHLQVISELMKSMLYGAISDRGLAILKGHIEREPLNPLYNAAYHLHTDGDMNRATDLLLAMFPHDRLPTSTDNFCSEYVLQRDADSMDQFGQKNWLPCTREDELGKTFDGTDFIFAAQVILGELKN